MPVLETRDSQNKEYCLRTADNWEGWRMYDWKRCRHVFLTVCVRTEGGDAHLEFEVAGSAPSEPMVKV